MLNWRLPTAGDPCETWMWFEDGHVLATVSREGDNWIAWSSAAGQIGEASSRLAAMALIRYDQITGTVQKAEGSRVIENAALRVGPEVIEVGPSRPSDVTVSRSHQRGTYQENTMSECNCARNDCVNCNTGWIQADLREGNLNFRAAENTAAANFRTSETNAGSNAQGAIRDLDRGFTAGALAASVTQQITEREAATTRHELAAAELRQANIAAANATVAAAHAYRTDQLVQQTAFQTQKDLATGFCDLKTQLAKVGCDIERVVTAEAVQTRGLILNQELQRTQAENQNLRADLREKQLSCQIDKCCICLSNQIGRHHHHQPAPVA